MTRIATVGFEAAGDTPAPSINGSAFAYDAAQKVEGARSIKIDNDVTNARVVIASLVTERSYFARVYFRQTAEMPADCWLFTVKDTATNPLCSIRGGGSNTFKLLDAFGSTIATGIAQPAINSDNYVEVRVRQHAATADDQVEVRMNGVTVFNGTTNNLGNPPETWQVGGQFGGGSGYSVWYDALVVNDDQGASDNTWPGALGGGAATVTPGGIPSAEAWGSPTLATSVGVAPGGIASAEAWGTGAVNVGAVDVAPGGIASAEAWGGATVVAGAVDVAPSGIPSAEAWGSPTLDAGAASVELTGIPSAEAFGDAAVAPGAVDVTPGGIPSAEAFGATAVTVAGQDVTPAGIPSAEAWGASTVTAGDVAIATTGIPSAETWGTGTLTRGDVTVAAGGILSAEAWGSPAVEVGAYLAEPVDLPTMLVFDPAPVDSLALDVADADLAIDSADLALTIEEG